MATNFPRGPFGNPISLRGAMNGLLEDSYVWPSPNGHSPAPSVAVDIWQTQNELVVRTQAPGVRPEDLSISVLNGTLTMMGDCKSEPIPPSARVLRQEIGRGEWQRSFELPFSVQVDNAEACFEHGVLTLTLPRAEQ